MSIFEGIRRGIQDRLIRRAMERERAQRIRAKGNKFYEETREEKEWHAKGNPMTPKGQYGIEKNDKWW